VKSSNQLKARIRNLSTAKNVNAEIILRSFMMERFLERVSLSVWKDSFILKGGILVAKIVGIESRTTMDMDATINDSALTSPRIAAILDEILRVPVDDGVSLMLTNIEEIRDEAEYPGWRASINALLDKTRQTLKVDITTGDAVTPREEDFHLMFEERTITLMTYTLETVLAEKVETIMSRSVANTRMRDFYDVYILTTTQSYNQDLFKADLEKTAARRHTTDQMTDMNRVIRILADSSVMSDLWRRYQKRNNYAMPVTWSMAIAALTRLIAQ